MAAPKKNGNNFDVLNIGNNEILPIPNDTTSREKESSRNNYQIAPVPGKELLKNTQNNNSNNNKRNYPANEKIVDNSKLVIILEDSIIKHDKWMGNVSKGK